MGMADIVAHVIELGYEVIPDYEKAEFLFFSKELSGLCICDPYSFDWKKARNFIYTHNLNRGIAFYAEDSLDFDLHVAAEKALHLTWRDQIETWIERHFYRKHHHVYTSELRLPKRRTKSFSTTPIDIQSDTIQELAYTYIDHSSNLTFDIAEMEKDCPECGLLRMYKIFHKNRQILLKCLTSYNIIKEKRKRQKASKPKSRK